MELRVMKKTITFGILTAFICAFSVGGVFAENEAVSATEGETEEIQIESASTDVNTKVMLRDPASREEAYEDKIWEILNGMDPNWSDIQKLFYLHDYLVTNCQYDKQERGGAYEALLDGKAGRHGYAFAFYDLANLSGIETEVVSSPLGYIDLVSLNGKGYFVHCALDDSPGLKDFSTGETAPYYKFHCDHRFFLLSQDGCLNAMTTQPERTDWMIISSGDRYQESVLGKYNDKSFDDIQWQRSSSPVIIYGDEVLFAVNYRNMDSSINYEAGLYSYDCRNGNVNVVMDSDFINASVETGIASITNAGNTVFLCIGSRRIYYLNKARTEFIHLYTLNDADNWIKGIKAEGCTLYYDVFPVLSDFEKDIVRRGEIDLSGIVSSISLNKAIIRFKGTNKDQKKCVSANILSGNGEIIWITSDPKVAVVDNGVVTPAGYGSAIITASMNESMARCRVNVDTSWQDDYDTGTFKHNGKNMMRCRNYKGGKTDVRIPSTAYVSGVSCNVVVDDLKYNYEIKKISFEPGTYIRGLNLYDWDKLESIELNGTDWSMKNTGERLFYGCSSLKRVDLSEVKNFAPESMLSMFCGCDSLTDIDISGIDTENADDMSGMFSGCSSLTSVDLSKVKNYNPTSMSGMFMDCRALKSIEFGEQEVNNVTDTSFIFDSCISLEKLDLSCIDASNIPYNAYNPYPLNHWFDGCINGKLKKIKTPRNLKIREVRLPATFADPSGKRYYYLPAGLSDSIELTWAGPYIEDEVLHNDPSIPDNPFFDPGNDPNNSENGGTKTDPNGENRGENDVNENGGNGNSKNENSGNNGYGGNEWTVSDNIPLKKIVGVREGYEISYHSEVPFWGKSKPSVSWFGDILVTVNGETYKATKIKVNKKKHRIQITGLDCSDKKIRKAVKKATKGTKGLYFDINPYYVRESDVIKYKFKKGNDLKFLKIMINGKLYKAKKTEYDYSPDTGKVTFYGANLSGECKVN